MRRPVVLSAVVGVLAVACGGGEAAPMRYYDPWGNFTVDVPARTLPGPVMPQEDPVMGTLLSAVVISEEPDANPPPQFGIGTTQQQEVSDILQVAVIENPAFTTAEDMIGLQLEGTSADMKIREPLQLGGVSGLLVVADHAGAASSASVFAVVGEKAYWVWYIFPFEAWPDRKAKLFDFISDFRFGVPASVHLEFGPG